MRKFLVIVVLFLAAAFIYLSFSEIESVAETLQQGNLWFILLAFMIQVSWYAVAGLTYQSLYDLLGMQETVYKLSLLYASANFVNTVAPSAGVGGMAVFIGAASRDGHSVGKVTGASMLSLFLDYIAFLCILTLGLIVLFRRNDLDPTEIIASAVILIIAMGLGALLYLGSQSGRLLGDTLAWMARLVNHALYPFLHREYLSEARAHEFAEEMAHDMRALPERPRSLILPFLYALTGKILLMLVLMLVFLAFKVPFTAGTIIGGFSITYLFLIVSPTPSGIGIIEGIMPLALSSLRVPWAQAVIITLAYRGITFWIPLGLGAIAFRILEREKK
ncbi:MAG TPA: flippase-like domain-containing protein [Anaerolineales bacterium]|nr:flippase-like domain-containing protein [Anaerolineales bacterium]